MLSIEELNKLTLPIFATNAVLFDDNTVNVLPAILLFALPIIYTVELAEMPSALPVRIKFPAPCTDAVTDLEVTNAFEGISTVIVFAVASVNANNFPCR